MSSHFLTQLGRRVLVLDGAMGTSIHNLDLDLDRDYLGKENCTEVLVKTRPDAIEQIHGEFLEAGADAVETDTFGANKLVLAEFDLTDETRALNRQAAEIARAACEKHSTDDKPRFVFGSMGPGTRLITLGQVDWDSLFDSYREQARGLVDGGVDVFLIETSQDILQVKCAINAILAALEEQGKTPDDIPIMAQVTIETTGTMLVGTEIAAAATILEHYPLAALGINCATGPVEMAEHVHWLSRYSPFDISVVPNAGLPTLVEGRTEYPLGPEPFAEKLVEFVEEWGVSIVGGCCGTTPDHIRALAKAMDGRAPGKRPRKELPPSCASLYGPVAYRQDNSLLNVGERTNASGSRKFKRLLEEENYDEMISLARGMAREGSHVIDINVDYAGRDNQADMSEIVSRIVRQVNVPLMLDSTQPETIEAGLRRAPGKCIINSANLEDGEEKFAELCRLARTYNAGLVLGCIDEDPDEAMARTADRKLAIASRMFHLAVNTYGLAPEEIFIDPLVLPVSTGMEKDRRSALETIEGTRRIAERFPQIQITCGLSNVSFGLKPAARVVLNSAFLHELEEAGLTSAILHVSKIVPKNRVPEEQWQAALDLIYNRPAKEPRELVDGNKSTDPLQLFIDLFHDVEAMSAAKEQMADRTLEERLQYHIIDGEKQGLIESLDEALEQYSPLDIINEHLLGGMKTVGELFGAGEMQLPFVLQSAEVMKMAVAHLEPHMEKAEGQTRGSIVLATVKGDVHDIGKNLVDIILSNNGYTVHNIGIKQPVSNIIAAFNEHKADAIGLSGLLVKSVNVMEENLREFNEQGVNVPLLLGGAALARHYAESHLRPQYDGKLYYGKDAFDGLRLMDHIMGGKTDVIDEEIEDRLAKRAAVEAKVKAGRRQTAAETSAGGDDKEEEGGVAVLAPSVDPVETVPRAPFFGSRLIEDIELGQIYPYINTTALFRGQWQFRKGKRSPEEYEAQLEDEVIPIFDRLKHQCREENILRPRLVYGYYPCNSDGNDLIIYDPEDHDREIERFTFPRQERKDRLCIADFFRSTDSGEKDVLGLTCVTMGEEVSRRAKALFEGDDYAEYLYMHGMGVESAEALAELWHKRMRTELGIGNDDAPEISKLFTQHYRGSRYSPGYPACPDMSDQEKIFRLLEPERIGCRLTENWQIDPEQSTSAIVVHHPRAKYFNV